MTSCSSTTRTEGEPIPQAISAEQPTLVTSGLTGFSSVSKDDLPPPSPSSRPTKGLYSIVETVHSRSGSSSTAALSISSSSGDTPQHPSPSLGAHMIGVAPTTIQEDSVEPSSAKSLVKERTLSNLSFREVYGDEGDNDSCTDDFPLEDSSFKSPSSSSDKYPKSKISMLLKTPPDCLAPTAQPVQLHPGASPASLETLGLLPPPAVAAAADSADSSVRTVESAIGSSMGSAPRRAPVLYSAIGSLENPTHSYQNQWKAHLQNKKNQPKYEFPSTRQLSKQGADSTGFVVPQQSQDQQQQKPILQLGKPAEHQTHKKLSSLSATMTAFAEGESALTPHTANTLSTGTVAMRTTSPADASPAATTAALSELSKEPKRSSLRTGSRFEKKPAAVSDTKKVTISLDTTKKPGRKKKKPIREMFRPSSDAYTPRMGKRDLKYKPAELRTPVQKMASPLGTLSRPNFRDALRRVAMIIHQHVFKIESRFEKNGPQQHHNDDLFSREMKEAFDEDKFVTPKYKCTMVRVPMARPGMVFGIKKIRQDYKIPSESEIYEFAHQLFDAVHLSSECSIVCLIYVERLMEQAKVPLMACTWRPIFMCGLLLASKVWQDLSSWNIEFASVYPQYSLDAINRLELLFLRMVKWDLYISSSQYAKYYFALRSLVEKQDFRLRYNRMVGGVDSVQASEARKVQERSTQVKEEALMQISRSM